MKRQTTLFFCHPRWRFSANFFSPSLHWKLDAELSISDTKLIWAQWSVNFDVLIDARCRVLFGVCHRWKMINIVDKWKKRDERKLFFLCDVDFIDGRREIVEQRSNLNRWQLKLHQRQPVVENWWWWKLRFSLLFVVVRCVLSKQRLFTCLKWQKIIKMSWGKFSFCYSNRTKSVRFENRRRCVTPILNEFCERWRLARTYEKFSTGTSKWIKIVLVGASHTVDAVWIIKALEIPWRNFS